MSKLTLSKQDLDLFSHLTERETGVVIPESKAYLFESRLVFIFEKYNFTSYHELYNAIKSNDAKVKKDFVDAITTHETSFFRDAAFYDMIKFKIIPDIFAKHKHVTIWSAACSTGQEAYSIAMILLEFITNIKNYQITIIGTDISDHAVAKASYGLFSDFEVSRGLPDNLKHKYFNKDELGWKVKDELRALTTFRHANLLERIHHVPKVHLLLCRNVAIYFSQENKEFLYQNLKHHMNDDTMLVVGASESLLFLKHDFEKYNYKDMCYYQKK